MRKAFINRFFPPSLFNRLLLEIKNFSQLICENLTDAWLRLKSMLRKCHGHGLTKGAIIQIFYHGLDEPTQGILDVTAGGIFLYKSPNQAFQFLDDKVLFKLDWSTRSQNDHHQKSVAFADGSDSNTDNSRFMEKLNAVDSQIISLNEELQDICNKYNELREGNASTNLMNNDTPMCERRYIQYEGNKNRNSQDSYSYQSHYDPNDSEKSLTELNKDVRNDLEDFKRCVHSMRTVHWKLFARDDVESVVQERENIKLKFQKLFNSIKVTRAQHQTKIDELLQCVDQNTYAYADVRAKNQDLLIIISELKSKLKTTEKGTNVNTKFDSSETLGKRVCVTPFNKHIADKAMNASNTKVNSDRSKPVTSKSTPKPEQGQKHHKNVITRGMYKINKQDIKTQDSKDNINVSNSTGVGSSHSVRRSTSEDNKSKNSILKNTKSSSTYVRKTLNSACLDF
ncbi:reverse transcriptase domain-containing protein [Tanacetum coccineum]